MKKLLLFFAALLPCFLAYSQGADDTGRSVDVQIIALAEVGDFKPLVLHRLLVAAHSDVTIYHNLEILMLNYYLITGYIID